LAACNWACLRSAPPKVGGLQLRLEVSLLQLRPKEIGAPQLCAVEVGILQLRMPKICAIQIRAGEIGALQLRAGREWTLAG
jgi:hypothetical protein